jgi:predicted ATP-grasp superfamily ATP-dependent carboligase
MNRREAIPALVVGETVTALGTLRSLARAGIGAFTVTSPGEFVRSSRWYKPIPGQEGLLPEAITEWLSDVAIDRAVLFPCSDHTVWQASRMAEGLKDSILMSIPSTSVIEKLVDKGQFASMLDKVGIPHPRTCLMEDGRVPCSLPDSTFDNAFLKPVDSQSFMKHFGVKAERVASKQQAVERLAVASEKGFSMLLQEYIPGPAHNHFMIEGFVDRHQKVKGIFARQRLRMHPPDFGNSSCMVSVSLDEVEGAAKWARRLLQEIGYRGIFNAEFKFDERDREFKILEVNSRPWWYIEFATRCGVNACKMAYLDALGEEVSEVGEYRSGARIVYTRHDYFACRDSVRRREMTMGAWARSWLRSWRVVFAWDDPWPSCVGTLRFLLQRPGRFLERLRRWTRRIT